MFRAASHQIMKITKCSTLNEIDNVCLIYPPFKHIESDRKKKLLNKERWAPSDSWKQQNSIRNTDKKGQRLNRMNELSYNNYKKEKEKLERKEVPVSEHCICSSFVTPFENWIARTIHLLLIYIYIYVTSSKRNQPTACEIHNINIFVIHSGRMRRGMQIVTIVCHRCWIT